MKYISIIIVLLCILSACSKNEGEGGSASIQGRVFAFNLNSVGNIADSAYIGDERIFISYGDHTIIDDETRTSYDGSYRFNNLIKGNYTIFIFSYCGKCPLNQLVLKKNVSITERKQKITLEDFKIFIN